MTSRKWRCHVHESAVSYSASAAQKEKARLEANGDVVRIVPVKPGETAPEVVLEEMRGEAA
ncbi:hypothetical protein [Streptomyces sp. NPDC050504]|uniref:hypothetical protein n=1 Tax=Streptomyces sp. NPDC050504 TaxID=3365618 RepID=UPI00379C3A34